ncbi:4-alpha-glucanotransferase [Rhodovulum iodosum]|uniref:4-alpha-glucanotransferase n=1 Tax=Rhodovulum iodosum TaxID=68291 RepID=A0ABV3XZD5_9RHOB|nr:4-alpha-glucanotransferase [Rhodovulum robiginosum]RSK34215.1 4-alpha-glucanotransferase [Rhodovulum robiginosum]
MSDEALYELARAVGVFIDYSDQMGVHRVAPPETLRAVLGAMGLAAGHEGEARDTLDRLRAAEAARPLPDWVIGEAGEPVTLRPARGGPWALRLEDGHELEGQAEDGMLHLPPLPLGRHRLTLGGHGTTILSAPARLPLPPRGWGVTLPLYGLAEGAGLGDYADLAAVVAGLARIGAGFVGLNPIHAGFPTDANNFSPYAPSSRRRFNIAHVPVDIPGQPGAMIDYGAELPARLAALRAEFAASNPDAPDFAAFRRASGAGLARFATHQALSDRLGPYWCHWPDAYRSPDSAVVAEFAAAHAGEVTFHAWAQWRAEAHLAEVRRVAEAGGMAQGLYLDLAVGVNPAGAETWAAPDQFARGVSLGAPPDAFAADGQTWGLAPFNPRALLAQGFAPLAETLAAQLRFAGMLRIDHILGFERAFWVPEGGLPGTYVAMPRDALMAVARIEAARVGAVIVGEDLGNIPEGLRAAMDASGLLGCRVAMFERDWHGDGHFLPPEAYPDTVLASFSTHDLPTWAGWCAARDIDWHQQLGHIDGHAAEGARAGRAHEVQLFRDALGGGEADALHAFLGRTPARLVAVQAEDVLGLDEQANLPGTVHEHPNWRRRLPVGAAALAADPRMRRTAEILSSTAR